MSAHLNEELLSAFLDGEVTAEERLQIEAQLAESPEWQRRYRQLVETVNLVRTLPQTPLEKDFSRDILSVARSRQSATARDSATRDTAASETMAAKVLQQPSAADKSGVSPRERSTSERSRKRHRSPSPAMYLVAACAIFVLGIGLVYQAGLFSGNEVEIAEQSPEPSQPPVPENLASSEDDLPGTTPEAQPEIGPTPERSGSRFPTVEELAQGQPVAPATEMEGQETSDQPIGFNIRVRRKPGAASSESMPSETESPARSGVLARSSIQLDRQDDLGFDQAKLTPITNPEVAEEFFNWLDTNGDGRVSDLEAQQAWQRFVQPSPMEIALSETVLSVIDQNEDEKLSPAELHAAVASLRWYSGETGQSLRKFWYRLDANNDLVWSSDDFPTNVQLAGSRTAVLRESLTQWHSLIDRSHDGKATALEFALSADIALQNLKAWEQSILNPQSYQATRALLDTYDRNQDDLISGRELRRFLQEQPDLTEILGDVPMRGFTAYELYLAVEAKEIQ